MAAMTRTRAAQPAGKDWLRPRVDSAGMSRYVAILRERWWLILLTTSVAVGVAVAYATLAPKTYVAEADLLITPVTSGNSSVSGLGLLTESNDPTQTVTTAARLVTTNEVGARALQRVGRKGAPDSIFQDVVVEPIAQSNLIAIRATARSPEAAAATATAVARAAIEVRTRQLRLQLDATIPTLQDQVAQLPEAERSGPGTLGERVSALQALRVQDDPTIRLATAASPPTGPASPKKKLALAAGLLGGLILGIGAAFAVQALDPRLRREEQLRDIYRLPVLGRIPRATRRPGASPIGHERLSQPAVEAFRILRATVTATVGPVRPQALLVTSSGPGEGKTTTALNLAYSLAQTGQQVILIEGDVRRPMLARTLKASPAYGMASVMDGSRSVADSLTKVTDYGENLSFLLAERPMPSFVESLDVSVAHRMLTEAEEIADFVIIDSPPLTEVFDALPLAQESDAVLIVVRLGRSRLKRLTELGEILAQGGARPIGIAEVGTEEESSSYYYDEPASSAVA